MEAEVEYDNHTSPSIYVKFLLKDLPIEHTHVDGEGLYFIYCIFIHGYKQGCRDRSFPLRREKTGKVCGTFVSGKIPVYTDSLTLFTVILKIIFPSLRERTYQVFRKEFTNHPVSHDVPGCDRMSGALILL